MFLIKVRQFKGIYNFAAGNTEKGRLRLFDALVFVRENIFSFKACLNAVSSEK
jgi:hypothetical protein